MSSTLNSNDHQDNLKKLHKKLMKIVTLLQNFRWDAQELLNNIGKLVDDYFSIVKGRNSAAKSKKINSQIRGSKKTKNEKIKKKGTLNKKKTKKIQLKKGAKTTNASPRKIPLVNVITNSTNPTNSVASVAVETSSVTGALLGARIVHSAEVLHMPVDSNEPTYCLCNQVSYGGMIACDNPDCPIEWFHFACVKLITKPKGKWFCPKCITNKKEKKHTFKIK